jgi:tetratricopeptide (TPR) repeat protein
MNRNLPLLLLIPALLLATISCSSTTQVRDPDEWIKLCTKIINHESGYEGNSIPNAYFQRASAEHTKGDLDAAIADYTQAIELLPNPSNAYINRGSDKGDKGDWDGAIADYTKAISFNDAFTFAAYQGRGLAKYHEKDFDGAIADYTKAIQLRPDDSVAYLARGDAKQAKGT